jgi:hypothetical protein
MEVAMADLLKALGVTGLPALAIIAAAWIFSKAYERSAKDREALRSSDLRQVEARLGAILDAQAALDVNLRDRREGVYGHLWRLGALVSRWPRNPSLAYSELDTLHLQLKDWYYEQQGGLWLSDEAREAYGDLQEQLAAPRDGAGPASVDVAGPDYERIMTAFSALRTELTRDLQSRVRTAMPAADHSPRTPLSGPHQ